MGVTGNGNRGSDAVTRLFAKNVYDVRVTYETRTSMSYILQAIHFRGFIGGRCRIRTCDFHRVKVALYR